MGGYNLPIENIIYNNMKKYFFRTEKDSNGKTLVFPIKNQKDEAGKDINPSLRVSCSKSVRESFKVPSYFVSSKLSLDKSDNFRCYRIYYD